MSFARLSAFSGVAKATRRSFATYKTSTGLVGIPVDPNGRENLLKLSNEILESVQVRQKRKFPAFISVIFMYTDYVPE